jgi:hypothetical protein
MATTGDGFAGKDFLRGLSPDKVRLELEHAKKSSLLLFFFCGLKVLILGRIESPRI